MKCIMKLLTNNAVSLKLAQKINQLLIFLKKYDALVKNSRLKLIVLMILTYSLIRSIR